MNYKTFIKCGIIIIGYCVSTYSYNCKDIKKSAVELLDYSFSGGYTLSENSCIKELKKRINL